MEIVGSIKDTGGYENSEVIRREPCPICRENGRDRHGDNKVVYADGHSFCFCCGTYWGGADNNKSEAIKGGKTGKDKTLITDGSFSQLKARGLFLDTVQKFNYQVGKYKGKPCQIANYYNNRDLLVAQHIRFPDKSFIWLGNYKDVQLFGQRLWRTGGKRVIVTEGEIDAMTISQLQGNKWPVVSIPSGVKAAKKALQKNLEWLESYNEVIIAFDMDEPGQEAAKECAVLFTPGKAKIARYPLKDANDMLRAGRGDELIDSLWSAQPYRPDGIVSGKDLWQVILEEPAKGFDIPYPLLNKKTMGIRKGELWLITAGSGIGKSTFVHELAYHLMQEHDMSIGIIALEESVKTASERYLSIALNRRLNITREGITEEELREAYSMTVGNGRMWFYDHFGSLDNSNLLSKIRYMAVGLGVDFVVLDHISIVISGLDDVITGDERKIIDILMTRLRSLVQETGIGILAVVHLKRPQQGKSWNEGKQVSLSDLRGSGSLEQLSDFVVAMERNQQSEDEEEANHSLIRVLKNRVIGDCGEADSLFFNPETGRLLPEGTIIEDTSEDVDIPF
jgi:twinkle protein